MCITFINNAFRANMYDSVVVELTSRPKKDYFLRVISSLEEDVINERHLTSKKLSC
jgi:hypothetical protein